MPNEGYSLCYINYHAWKTPADELFFERENADHCVRIVQSIDFFENYNKEKVHHWLGLTVDFKSGFLAKLTGYLRVARLGNYEFRVNATNTASMSIDNEPVVTVGSISGSYHMANVSRTLEEGFHLISVYYTYSSGSAALKIEWRLEGQNWATLDGGSLWFGRKGVIT